jgi:hypothetical protein
MRIDTQQLNEALALLEEHERQQAADYAQAVWSKHSLADYVAQAAAACADHAVMFVTVPRPRPPTFVLPDPDSDASALELGSVYFRMALPMDLAFLPAAQDWSPLAIGVERIALHPSIQRQGFLSSFLSALGQRGLVEFHLTNVANESLAAHFAAVAQHHPKRVRPIPASPGLIGLPSFAVDLRQW